MTALAGDPKYWKTCYSFFPCGTPLANTAGAEPLSGKRDFAKAKELVKEAGYNGEKIVVMSATDQPIVNAQALVTVELLKKARPQCRAAGDGLGHADHPPRLARADRQGRLEHLLHLVGGARSC